MKSLLFLTVLLFSQLTFSQNGWQVQIGGADPQSYNNDIFFLNNQTGWILMNNKIKYTSNGGDNWAEWEIYFPYNYYPGKMFFIDAYTGWVNRYGLFKTVNGGLNWQVMDSTINPLKIFFINNQTGWFSGYNGIIKKTINGGSNWSSVATGINENINAVYFLNEQTGFAAADWGKILTTTNGGINWSMYYDNVNYSYMESIEFINMQTGFVCATGGNIFKTTNAGINWQKFPTPNFSAFKDISFSDDQNGVVMGNGDIFRTTNGGNSWFQTASNGLFANTFGLEAIGNGKIWLITDSSLVYMSSDNAQSWVEKYRQFITFSNLRSIKFINSLTGCASGTGGGLIRTTNGGNNWYKITTGTTMDLNAIYFINQNTGFAAGGLFNLNNLILRTTNSGLNWAVVLNDTSGYLYNIFFLNENSGWAAGYRGVLKTTNSGLNWFRLSPYPQVLAVKDVEFLDENTGFAIRYSSTGGYYKTTNSGLNWTFYTSINISNSCMNFINTATGFILGNSQTSSVLRKTTDRGENWNDIFIGPNSFFDIQFINPNTGWIAGGSIEGDIKITSNGGINWQTQYINTNTSLNSINFVNESSGWACGYFGTVVHTSTGGIGIKKINDKIPESFRLQQNYPNPFNPVTKIRFELPSMTNYRQLKVNLSIYDILGRELETLVNESLQAGTFEVVWNASKYSSGIYFYSLTAGEFSVTKKMVLVK
jgi:photosystem II stability/assembly factor-like uncharacterized protein